MLHSSLVTLSAYSTSVLYPKIFCAFLLATVIVIYLIILHNLLVFHVTCLVIFVKGVEPDNYNESIT